MTARVFSGIQGRRSLHAACVMLKVQGLNLLSKVPKQSSAGVLPNSFGMPSAKANLCEMLATAALKLALSGLGACGFRT